MAQGISIALYMLAFAESWLRIFPTHPKWVVAIVSYTAVFIIIYISTKFTTKTQFLTLIIVGFSEFFIFLASFPILGQSRLAETPVF